MQITYQCPGGSFSGLVGSGGTWALNVPSDWNPDDCGLQPFIITAQDLSWGMHWNESFHLYAPANVSFVLHTAISARIPTVVDYVNMNGPYASVVATQGTTYQVINKSEVGGNGVTSTFTYTVTQAQESPWGQGLEVDESHWVTGEVNFSAYGQSVAIEGVQIGGESGSSKVDNTSTPDPYSLSNPPPDSGRWNVTVGPNYTATRTVELEGSVSNMAGLDVSLSMGVNIGPVDVGVSFTIDLELTVTQAQQNAISIQMRNPTNAPLTFVIYTQGYNSVNAGIVTYVWLES